VQFSEQIAAWRTYPLHQAFLLSDLHIAAVVLELDMENRARALARTAACAAATRVVQVLEKTIGHARTFARNFSFLAVFLPGGFSTMG
jgi:hypothetical protein